LFWQGLLEKLLVENKMEKAKEVIDIAMTHTPVEHYGYDTFVEPFLDGYFKVGATEQAKKTYLQLKRIYEDELEYYKKLPVDESYDRIEDILENLQGYRRLIDILMESDEKEFADQEMQHFNTYLETFQFLLDQG
jgi:hypothetical protein